MYLSLKNIGNGVDTLSDVIGKSKKSGITDIAKQIDKIDNIDIAQKADLVSNAVTMLSQNSKDAVKSVESIGESTIKSGSKLSDFGAALKGVGKSLVSFASVHPVITGITATIAAVALLSTAIEDVNEKRQKAANSYSDYQSTITEIESINGELETTNNRIDELQAKGHLTFTESSELANLQAQNAELERQLELKTQLSEVQGTQAAKDAAEALSDSSLADQYDTGGGPFNSIKTLLLAGLDYMGFSAPGAIEDVLGVDVSDAYDSYAILESKIHEAEKLRDEISDLSSKQSEANYDAIQSQIDEKTEEVESLEKVIQSQYENIDTLAQAFYDSDGNVRTSVVDDEKRYKEAQQAYLDYFNVVSDGESSLNSAFNTIMSKSQFSGIKDQLVEAGKDGTIAIQNLIKETPGLSKAFDEAGLSIDDVVSHIQALSDPDALNIKGIAQNLAEAFSGDPKESVTAFNSRYNAFKKFRDKISDEELKIFYEYVTDSDIDLGQLTSDELEATLTVALKGAEETTAFGEALQSIYERVSLIDQTVSDLNAQPYFDAIAAADETANAGDDYVKAVSDLEKAKELYDQGLIGTDDFKSRAAYLSPTGADDPANFLENYSKATRYLTEDSSGVENFLEDLESKGYATFTTLSDGTKQWSYDIDSLEEAAQNMGMGFDFMLDMFGRLNDYGFSNNFVASLEDGKDRIAELSGELVREQAKLYEMETTGQYTTVDENGNKVQTFANQTAIDAQREKVQGLRDDILATQDAMAQLTARSADDFYAQQEAATTAIEKMAEERKRILEDNTYGEDTENVAKLMEEQIKQWANENQLELDADLNVKTVPENVEELTEFLSDTLSSSVSEAVSSAEISLNSLQDLGLDNTDISFDVGLENIDQEISKAQELLNHFKSEDGTVDLSVSGAEDAINVLTALVMKKQELSQPAVMNVDTSALDGDIETVITKIQEYQSAREELSSMMTLKSAGIDIDTSAAEQKVANLSQEIQSMSGSQAEILAKLNIDTTSITTINSTLDSLSPEVMVKAGIDSSAIDNYDPEDKEGKVTYSVNDKAVRAYTAPNKSGKVIYTADTSNLPTSFGSITRTVNYVTGTRPPRATGTLRSPAYASGTAYNVLNYKSAFADGKVSLPKDEEALVNELGTESIIRDGQWFLVPGGMHVQSLKKGDIVLSAKQTADLLATGKAIGHGTAYAAGSGGGSFGSGGSGSKRKSSSSSTKNSNSSSSNRATSQNTSAVQSNTDAVKENTEATKQTFDWIEQMISVQERSFNYFEKAIDDFEQSYNQNRAIDQYTGGAQIYLETLRNAQNTYMSKANALGLSGDYIHKIWAGDMSIEDVTDEDTANKIQQYEEWYEKARDLGEQIEDINRSLREAKISKLDNIKDDYDNLKSYHESIISYNEALNDYSEQLNLVGNEDILWNNLDQQKQIKAYMQTQKKELEKQLDALVADGTIAMYSDTWQKWKSTINEVSQAIIECDSAVLDLKESIREIRLDNFNKMLDTLEFTSDMAQSVRDLMSDADLWDDDVKITDSGLAQLGLMSTELISAKQQVANYNVAIEALGKDLKNGNISQAQYNEQLREYQKSQMDAVAATKDARDAILDLIREGINKETEAMENLISKRKEALQAQKDADDYAKSVADKQKEINMIQAQINALDGNDSLSAEAERRRLNNQLLELQDDLNQTMEDHKYDMIQQGYDDALDAFKENQDETLSALNNSLASQNAAISNMLESAKNNYQIVYDQIQAMASQYGVTLTDSLTKPWQSAQAALQQYQQSMGKLTGNVSIDTSKIQSNANVQTTAPKGEAATATTDKSKTGTWINQDGRWWYQHTDGGWTENAWEKIDNKWYKFDTEGWMQTGWQPWGKDSQGRLIWYYLNPSGDMATSTWISGEGGKQYYVDSTGAMVRDAYVKSKDKNLYYWVNSDGVWEPQWDTATPDLKKYRLAYAGGTSRSQSGPALTDEEGLGSEVIITPSGVIRQLQAGSTVLSKSQVDYLYNLSKNAAQTPKLSSSNMAGILSENTGGDTYEFHIDRMMNIEGNVTKDVFPGVKQMCEMATDYMLQQANKTAKRIGKTRYK